MPKFIVSSFGEGLPHLTSESCYFYALVNQEMKLYLKKIEQRFIYDYVLYINRLDLGLHFCVSLC